jgi:hypothetical protein
MLFCLKNYKNRKSKNKIKNLKTTCISLGCFLDSLYKSSDPILDLLIEKLNDGPISSSSIFGIFVPDFLSMVLLKKKKSLKYRKHFIKKIIISK